MHAKNVQENRKFSPVLPKKKLRFKELFVSVVVFLFIQGISLDDFLEWFVYQIAGDGVSVVLVVEQVSEIVYDEVRIYSGVQNASLPAISSVEKRE